MAPHDQHWVVTGLELASIRTPDLSGCWVPAILQFGGAEAPYFIYRPYQGSVCRTSGATAARASRSGCSRYRLLCEVCYEKELPQPQDFLAFGFWNTKP